ncbi:hypothetical protein WJX77_007623 [Trebouxia sp. C0004]
MPDPDLTARIPYLEEQRQLDDDIDKAALSFPSGCEITFDDFWFEDEPYVAKEWKYPLVTLSGFTPSLVAPLWSGNTKASVTQRRGARH